jgi:hypothetical protein
MGNKNDGGSFVVVSNLVNADGTLAEYEVDGVDKIKISDGYIQFIGNGNDLLLINVEHFVFYRRTN